MISDSHSTNLLDLIPAEELKQFGAGERFLDSVVVGMAEDRAEAFEVTRVIVDTVYHTTGGFDMRKYFLNVF